MKRIYVFLAAVAASLAIGCTQVEEISSSDIIYSPTFYASFEDADGMDTKTYVDNKLTMRWTKDDEVSIFVGNTLNQEYKYAGETGANNGSFNPLTTPGFYAADPLNANYAVYPFSNTNEMDADGGMSLILPAVQHYAENTFGLGANVMVAATKNTSDMMLQFRNLSGYLVLKLYGDETVKSITFEGNNGEKISGKAYVTAVSGYFPELDMDETGTTSITLDCGDGIPLGSTSATATEFWFCIPPTTFSDGFTITVTNTDGLSMIKSVASSRTIERNMKVSMAALETNCDTMLGNVEFEDANFKAYCVENFDTDGDGEISSEEALAVTVMSFDTNGMKNLEGVEYFQNLQYLNCSLTYYRGSRGAADDIWHNYDSNNVEVFGLESLDVSKNTSLTYLSCRYNQLTSLDLSKNTALTYLECDYNLLTSLDVSKNTALTDLNCGNNQLTSLDVSKNTALTDLAFQHNYLTSLDVSKNTALTNLECDYNLLISLDVTKNTALTYLAFQYNHLTSLDVSGCTALTRLWCNNNQLTSLDVSKNTAMTELICGGNQLTSLDVSNNTALYRLWCTSNQLTSLDVSNNATLYSLDCSNNQLTSLDVSGCTALTSLSCWNNPYLTEIWFSKDQTIPSSFTYDTNIATIKRYGEPDAVDLGLSVKWASFNLGATSPEEYGNYYAWGETEIDLDFGWNYYVWAITGTYRMSKYCTDYTYGTVDNKTVLDLEDDVAHATLGGDWRMPTNAELIELVNNCTWTWTTQNNVNGYLVSSKTNSNSIFLPAAGHSLSYQVGSYGRYWSSTLYTGNEQFSYGLQFNISSVSHSSVLERYQGLSIRAVCKQ